MKIANGYIEYKQWKLKRAGNKWYAVLDLGGLHIAHLCDDLTAAYDWVDSYTKEKSVC